MQGRDYWDDSGNDKTTRQGADIFVKWRLKGHQKPKEQRKKEEEKEEEKGISALQVNRTKEGAVTGRQQPGIVARNCFLSHSSQRFPEVGDSNIILHGF